MAEKVCVTRQQRPPSAPVWYLPATHWRRSIDQRGVDFFSFLSPGEIESRLSIGALECFQNFLGFLARWSSPTLPYRIFRRTRESQHHSYVPILFVTLFKIREFINRLIPLCLLPASFTFFYFSKRNFFPEKRSFLSPASAGPPRQKKLPRTQNNALTSSFPSFLSAPDICEIALRRRRRRRVSFTFAQNTVPLDPPVQLRCSALTSPPFPCFESFFPPSLLLLAFFFAWNHGMRSKGGEKARNFFSPAPWNEIWHSLQK